MATLELKLDCNDRLTVKVKTKIIVLELVKYENTDVLLSTVQHKLLYSYPSFNCFIN